jgi:hypothetical protein
MPVTTVRPVLLGRQDRADLVVEIGDSGERLVTVGYSQSITFFVTIEWAIDDRYRRSPYQKAKRYRTKALKN